MQKLKNRKDEEILEPSFVSHNFTLQNEDRGMNVMKQAG